MAFFEHSVHKKLDQVLLIVMKTYSIFALIGSCMINTDGEGCGKKDLVSVEFKDQLEGIGVC